MTKNYPAPFKFAQFDSAKLTSQKFSAKVYRVSRKDGYVVLESVPGQDTIVRLDMDRIPPTLVRNATVTVDAKLGVITSSKKAVMPPKSRRRPTQQGCAPGFRLRF